MSAREHDESKVALDIEAAYLHKLAKHEQTIMAREEARHRRRLQALGPGSSVEDRDFHHGDCQEIMPALPRASIDLPVKYEDADGVHPRSWGDLAVMEPFFTGVFREMRRIAGDGQVYVCCDGDTYPVFFKAAYSLWPQSHMLVWYKPTGRRGRGWMHSHELILHARTQATTYTEGFRQDVIGIMPVRTLNREHPAEKPGNLWGFLMEGSPATYRTLIDPFMGSGSALVAAKARGMHAIGIEIEERYCEIAARRMGQDAFDLGTAA